MNFIKAKYAAFMWLWFDKVPDAFTRASLQVPFKGSTSDKAVFACGVATVALGVALRVLP